MKTIEQKQLDSISGRWCVFLIWAKIGGGGKAVSFLFGGILIACFLTFTQTSPCRCKSALSFVEGPVCWHEEQAVFGIRGAGRHFTANKTVLVLSPNYRLEPLAAFPKHIECQCNNRAIDTLVSKLMARSPRSFFGRHLFCCSGWWKGPQVCTLCGWEWRANAEYINSKSFFTPSNWTFSRWLNSPLFFPTCSLPFINLAVCTELAIEVAPVFYAYGRSESAHFFFTLYTVVCKTPCFTCDWRVMGLPLLFTFICSSSVINSQLL